MYKGVGIDGWKKGILHAENDGANKEPTNRSSGKQISLNENPKIASPAIIRVKGRPPTKRKQSVVEKIVKQKRGRKKKIDRK